MTDLYVPMFTHLFTHVHMRDCSRRRASKGEDGGDGWATG